MLGVLHRALSDVDTHLCVCLDIVCICVEWGLWVLCVYVGTGCALWGPLCIMCAHRCIYILVLCLYTH